MRKKRILGGLIIGAAALAAAISFYLARAPQPDANQPVRRAAPEAKPAESRFSALPSREPIGKARGELFGSRSWTPPAPSTPVAVAPPKPVAPPLPYRVAGQLMHDGVTYIVLAKDDRVLTVREGEMLDDDYRVDKITKDEVAIVYVPLKQRQVLPVASLLNEAPPAASAPQSIAAAEPSAASGGESARPALLRWERQASEQNGNVDIALKLTSEQPVRSSSLQVNFDAKVLEPVSVRPGDFFTDGKFSYRVNPEGSIFIGGFANGAAAADSEVVILSFRPIGSGAAELKISSLLLQGAAGRAIAHEPPVAFRTPIVQ